MAEEKDKESTESINYSNLDLTRQVLQKIREYMAAEKISMSEFARQTGVSKAWLSKLKHTDANLSLNTAQDLLHYMGYTLRLTREGSVSIHKSRIRKYAEKISKNLMKEDVQLHISSNEDISKNLMKEGDGVSQVAPTPGSTIPTTVQTTVTPSIPTPMSTQPVKLNPGQSLTISANLSDEELLTAAEFSNNENMSKIKNEKVIKIAGSKKNKLNAEELNLLYEALNTNNTFFTSLSK